MHTLEEKKLRTIALVWHFFFSLIKCNCKYSCLFKDLENSAATLDVKFLSLRDG